jgi:hypothetical protein
MEGVDPIPSAAPHFAGTAASAGNCLKHNLELITPHLGDKRYLPEYTAQLSSQRDAVLGDISFPSQIPPFATHKVAIT